MSIRPHNASQVKLTQEQMYEIIREPIVTEKSTLGSQFGQVTFKVGLLATKPDIKVAIEQLFDRKVKAVNTLRQKGKVKRFRGRIEQFPASSQREARGSRPMNWRLLRRRESEELPSMLKEGRAPHCFAAGR